MASGVGVLFFFCTRIGAEAHLRDHSFGLDIKPVKPHVEVLRRTPNSFIIPQPGEKVLSPDIFRTADHILILLAGQKGQFSQYSAALHPPAPFKSLTRNLQLFTPEMVGINFLRLTRPRLSLLPVEDYKKYELKVLYF